MSKENKSAKVVGGLEYKQPGFLTRNRVYIVGFVGLLALHVAWDRLVNTYVPDEEKTNIRVFRYLKKLDPFPRE